MNRTKAVVGAAMLLGAAACGAAQEATRAMSEVPAFPAAKRILVPSSSDVSRTPPTRQRPRLTLRFSSPSSRPAPPAVELRARFGERDWNQLESPFDGLRERIRIEKSRNAFRRESRLTLASVGPLRIAAFEAHQRGASLDPATEHFASRAGENVLQLINLSRPGNRSYGLCLALRWN